MWRTVVDYFKRPWHVGTIIVVLVATIAVIRWPEVAGVKELGTALMAVGFYAIVIDGLFREALFRDINKTVEDGIGNVGKAAEELLDRVHLIRGAMETGLQDIVAARHSTPSNEILKQAILEQLRSGRGEIRVAAVAAPDLWVLQDERGRPIWREMHDRQCTLKVLLLTGQWRNVRATLENGPGALAHYTTRDINEATVFLVNLQKEEGKERVQYKFYDFCPPVFLLITDQAAFVEPYPIIPNEVVGGGPIGGHVPMLQHASGSRAYRVWRWHYDFLWQNPDPLAWTAAVDNNGTRLGPPLDGKLASEQCLRR